MAKHSKKKQRKNILTMIRKEKKKQIYSILTSTTCYSTNYNHQPISINGFHRSKQTSGTMCPSEAGVWVENCHNFTTGSQLYYSHSKKQNTD